MYYKKERFDLDKPLQLPKPIKHRKVKGKNLFIAINVPTWIVLSDRDSYLFKLLLNNISMREAVKSHSYKYNQREIDSLEQMKKLISLLYTKDFFNKSYIASDDNVKRVRNIQFHLTNRCNLRCIHCYMDSGIKEYDEIDTKQWLALIDEASERYGEFFLSITGGEPLLYKGHLEILRYAKSKGAKTGMISNGMAITEQKVQELNTCLDNLQISLDGASEEVNDKIRGKGVFNRVTKSLKLLKNSDVRVGLNITVMNSNAQDIQDNLYNYINNELGGMKLDLDLSSFVSEGRGVNLTEEINPSDFASTLSYTAEHFVDKDAWMPTPSYPRRNCGYGNTIDIYPNGDVSPCLTPRFIRGNFIKDGVKSLFDIIDHEHNLSMVDLLPECKTCDLRYVCGGRCHLGTLTKGEGIGQVDCPDQYKENMFNNLVRQFEATTRL
ncbi:radical SAM/SPASM domain-containing protein [Bacillus chungangensis]|uniref:Radical SAM protein with 4Fe4S-binding SPASM domain n=1 Tax=Bacillus chungangensis TaxID=587633 RepID=A0ABT9WVH1_9BACI|nr:radical SAM protein [Bacillus chungangensis]MDQ0177307.1 radical SAM protein with 4Fe4S-binding SPASM domain [Bacillus chungangensis]